MYPYYIYILCTKHPTPYGTSHGSRSWNIDNIFLIVNSRLPYSHPLSGQRFFIYLVSLSRVVVTSHFRPKDSASKRCTDAMLHSVLASDSGQPYAGEWTKWRVTLVVVRIYKYPYTVGHVNKLLKEYCAHGVMISNYNSMTAPSAHGITYPMFHDVDEIDKDHDD